MYSKIEIGDYVVVKSGVWDPSMPKGRNDGLVVEIKGLKKDQMVVMFCNGEFLKFHKSQLQICEKIY